ncbi:uncharacterized protein LOC108912533 [Anoplophora glabripennis]|uniref:uncharacterized protein LOC108912533 n=1 Tax=Anoplophora glabripennis TaxID=217634 RepID=UPI000874C266|nr:uncharacterized protein LOC108912533 [Anoplophora glabripennis]
MAQGKLKTKAKVPQNVKTKKSKGNAVTKRSNCPIKPKKKQHDETQKLKQIVSKAVNKTVEQEIRTRAMGNQKKLSKVQEAVAKHQSKPKP